MKKKKKKKWSILFICVTICVMKKIFTYKGLKVKNFFFFLTVDATKLPIRKGTRANTQKKRTKKQYVVVYIHISIISKTNLLNGKTQLCKEIV